MKGLIELNRKRAELDGNYLIDLHLQELELQALEREVRHLLADDGISEITPRMDNKARLAWRAFQELHFQTLQGGSWLKEACAWIDSKVQKVSFWNPPPMRPIKSLYWPED